MLPIPSFDDIIHCKSLLSAQIIILLSMIPVMYMFLDIMTSKFFRPLMLCIPHAAQKRFAKIIQQQYKSSFYCELTLEQSFNSGCVGCTVGLAHIIGGLLCVPSVFGLNSIISPQNAYLLARFGALSESAWELQDMLKRAYEIFYLGNQLTAHHTEESLALSHNSMKHKSSYKITEALNVLHDPVEPTNAQELSRKLSSKSNSMKVIPSMKTNNNNNNNSNKIQVNNNIDTSVKFNPINHTEIPITNPIPLLIVLAIHHVIGQSMVIPMNIYYPDNACYHELIFLLLFAAGACLAIQNISYTLDISNLKGLILMFILSCIAWLILLYSRLFRFFYVVYKLLLIMYVDGAYGMIVGGTVGVILMSIFNILLILDSTKKVIKYGRKLINYKKILNNKTK